jgi:hypothetical protein
MKGPRQMVLLTYSTMLPKGVSLEGMKEIEPTDVLDSKRRKSMTRFMRLFVMALGFILANLIIASNVHAQVFSFRWGSLGSGDGQFNKPIGIAIDSSGNLYVSGLNNNRIQKFDGDGNFLTKWGSSGQQTDSSVGPTELSSTRRAGYTATHEQRDWHIALHDNQYPNH